MTEHTSRISSEVLSEITDHLHPQRLGLPEDEMDKLVEYDGAVSIYDERLNKEVPSLVPIGPIDWFNSSFINRTYGRPLDTFYFPPYNYSSLEEKTKRHIGEVLAERINAGGVVIVDAYKDKPQERLDKVRLILPEDTEIVVENLGGGEQERYLNQYVAEVVFDGQPKEFRRTESTFEAYNRMLANNELPDASINGVSCIDVVSEDEIESLWQLYDEPFAELAEEHPINAGYDEPSFKELLRDPSVVKIVNRVGGDITTLCMFLTDLDQCPWLDKEYYETNHPEAYSTDNIFVFLGIVTDKNRRGNDYASDVVDLLTAVTARRNSSVIVTFECNEISENVTPHLVKAAIENSGLAHVEGLDHPASQLSYYAIRKPEHS